MPFFSETRFLNEITPRTVLGVVWKPILKTALKSFQQIQLRIKKTVSLQVPDQYPLNLNQFLIALKKRVLPFTSRMKGTMDGSMTVEAALALPLFLFFAVALMQPLVWLDRQIRIQTVVECFGEELCTYAYMLEKGGEEKKEEMESDGSDLPDCSAGGILSDTAASLWLLGKTREHADGVHIKKAEVPNAYGDIIFQVEYQESLPFFEKQMGGVTMRAGARKRIWTGIDGKLKSGRGTGGEGDGADGLMVYVGAGMGRYHFFRDCHYISNEYEAVTEEQAREQRTASGGRLSLCSVCRKGGAGGSGNAGRMVYITRAGAHYHYSASCSSMVSYVRCIPLEEASYLGACSYCSRLAGP